MARNISVDFNSKVNTYKNKFSNNVKIKDLKENTTTNIKMLMSRIIYIIFKHVYFLCSSFN